MGASRQAAQTQVFRDGRVFRQSFQRGVATGALREAAAAAGDPSTGTTIRFLYDRDIFTAGCSALPGPTGRRRPP